MIAKSDYHAASGMKKTYMSGLVRDKGESEQVSRVDLRC